MKCIDLVAFDLDGTLVDSAPDIIIAVNHTRHILELPEMKGPEIISFVGDGLEKLVERFIGEDGQHLREKAKTIFMAYYREHVLDHAATFPGVFDVLDYFRDKRRVIITNKHIDLARTITDHLDLTRYFDEILGVGSTPYRKPEAGIMLSLLERFHIEPDRALMIGDGIADVNLAKNTQVISCVLLNGFTAREILLSLNPDYACDNLSDLKSLFC